jgi:hypothetical protein
LGALRNIYQKLNNTGPATKFKEEFCNYFISLLLFRILRKIIFWTDKHWLYEIHGKHFDSQIHISHPIKNDWIKIYLIIISEIAIGIFGKNKQTEKTDTATLCKLQDKHRNCSLLTKHVNFQKEAINIYRKGSPKELRESRSKGKFEFKMHISIEHIFRLRYLFKLFVIQKTIHPNTTDFAKKFLKIMLQKIIIMLLEQSYLSGKYHI